MIRALATIPVDQFMLSGDLVVPDKSVGMVVFAHGSGSSRFSPRNQQVAEHLQDEGLATLLVDLLTPEEEEIDRVTRHLRFDISLLAGRLAEIGLWASAHDGLPSRKIAYFGASTGAAAALIVAARQPDLVSAVVSRGGRPDLAMHDLHTVLAPTLLIVGSRDSDVMALNNKALTALNSNSRLVVVPGASHLFEEPGALDDVARLASDWFVRWFKPDIQPKAKASD